MAATKAPSSNQFDNPLILGGLTILYIAATIIALLSLDQRNLWYNLTSICVVPLFILSPIVVISSPLPTRVKTGILLALIMVVMPIVGIINTTYLELAIQVCIFAGLALGLNIVVGFAGLLDLGYIAFFAVGAYLWAIFTSSAPTEIALNGWLVPSWAFFIFLFLGVGAAALVGILLGLPVLRLRGDYLAIVTLGFGEMIRILARNADAPLNLTNGSQGLHGVAAPPLPDALVGLTTAAANMLNVRLNNPDVVAKQLLFYFIAIALLGIIILIARRLEDSPIGRAWTAIREDEIAAIAMGIPLVRMKLLAFASGAAFGGAIGVLYAAKQTFIDPDSFELLQSIQILAMVIVGGLGGIKGVILGACIITMLDIHVLTNLSLQLNALGNADFVVPIVNFPIKNWPSQLDPTKYQPLIFGLILVLMMIFRPEGLLPERRRQMELHSEAADDIEDISNPAAEPVITSEKPEN